MSVEEFKGKLKGNQGFLRAICINLTSKERILWVLILLNAKKFGQVYISKLDLRSLKSILGEENISNLFNNLENKLKISVSKLYFKETEFKLPLEGEIFKFRPIKAFGIDEKDKLVVVLSEFAYPLIVEAKALYDKESFLNQIKLRSKHSQILYRFLKKHGNITVTVEELQSVFGISYKRFRDFSQRVFYPAVEEINDKTDIFVDFKFKKKGRGGKIEAVSFEVKKKQEAQ